MKRTQNKLVSKGPINQNLPDDVISDLKDSFTFYDKEKTQAISMMNFKNILHSFGFAKSSKKDLEEELKEHGIEPGRQTIRFNELLSVITTKWCRHGGKDEEARECFKVFDKKEKGYVTEKEFREVLTEMLDPHVLESDIKEFMQEVDPGNEGKFTFDTFIKMYQ